MITLVLFQVENYDICCSYNESNARRLLMAIIHGGNYINNILNFGLLGALVLTSNNQMGKNQIGILCV